MFAKTQIAMATTLLLGGAGLVAAPALAQQSASEQRIEITGSAIKRIDAETAVPVTVLKADELRAQGLTTVEQIVDTLTAMQANVGTSQTVGASYGGASFADLRGIGANKTLILLNGRRIANNAFDASAPDLNMIPVAALERVELLRDGASALYGTDAVGGVINFITRRDYTGGTVTLGHDAPEHPGGKAYNANIGFGFGDLAQNGFNVFGFVDFQKQDNIKGTQRKFNSRFPGGISKSPFPANYYQGDGSVIGNPDAPNCATGVFLIPGGDGTSCSMTTSKFVDYIPKSQRSSAFLKADLALNPNNTLSAEYFITRSEVKTLIAGVPYGFFAQNPKRPDGSPNPYYPGNPGSGFTPNIPISASYDGTAMGFGGPLTGPGSLCGPAGCTLADLGLTSGSGAVNSVLQPGFVWGNWRDIPNGQRGDKNVNTQQRLVLSIEGNAGKWDYQAGLTYNENKVKSYLISGYGSGDLIYEGILDGIVNPYGAQDAAGAAYVDSALLTGLLQFGRGRTTGVDARVGNSFLGDWFGNGRQAALAVGVEYHREDFLNQANYGYAVQVAASTGVDPNTYNAGKRDVYATYAELSLPLLETLDLTLSARYDHYSDVGNTTNPKLGVRWQPTRGFLVRGSYSTGFRAPSLYELNMAQVYTNSGNINDPLYCPDGKNPVAGAPVTTCDDQFIALYGGNKNLKPEKSKTFVLGFVAEPMNDVSFGLDYWRIELKDMIGQLSESVLLDPDNFQGWAAAYIHRNPNGYLSNVTQVCPGPACGFLDERLQNLGGVKTDGIDISASYRLKTGFGAFNFGYNGTWVHKYDYQDYPDGPWNRNVGAYVGSGPVFRWQHMLSVNWKRGAFSAGAAGHLKSGYKDALQYAAKQGHPEGHDVSQYATLDIYGGWEPIKGLNLLFGIKNLADRSPPLSYQTAVFQNGYDPRFYDPTGRTYYLRAGYSF